MMILTLLLTTADPNDDNAGADTDSGDDDADADADPGDDDADADAVCQR